MSPCSLVKRLALAATCLLPIAAAGPLRALADPVRQEAPSRSDQRVLPLRSTLSEGGLLELRGPRGQLQFALPLEAGAAVREAHLRVVYSSTPDIVAERSRLWVYLNGNGIAELPLAATDATRAEITLPAGLLAPGSNTLTLWSQQEHQAGCDARSASALWTRLDPANSYVALDVSRPERGGALSDLRNAAGFLRSVDAPATILTAGGIERTDLLQAGALAGQGLALRLGGKPLALRHGVADAAAMTAPGGKILLGTRDEIAAIAGPSLPEIAGPTLALLPAAAPSGVPTLVITGRTDAELLQAATGFADRRLELPDAASMTLAADGKPAAAAVKRSVEPGQEYRFAELKASLAGLSNGTEPRTTIELPLPPDMVAADDRKAVLKLNYAYPAGLASNSVLNVLVNDRYVSMIALDNPQGARVEGEHVFLPINLLKPGMNTLAFEPLIGTDGAAGCLARPGTATSVVISADSSIALPEVARVFEQPDLRLFGTTGFPYADPRIEKDAEVVVAGHDSATIGAAWTLEAKIAQVADRPLTGLRTSFAAGRQPRHAIIVGAFGAVDPQLVRQASTDMGAVRAALLDPSAPASPALSPPMLSPILGQPPQRQTALEPPALIQTLPFQPILAPPSRQSLDAAAPRGPVVASSLVGLDETAILDAAVRLQHWTRDASRRFERRLDGILGAEGAAAPTGLLAVEADGRTETAVVAAFQSPTGARRTTTLVTAATPEILERDVRQLVKPALWDRLSGDLVTWSARSPIVDGRSVADPYRLDDVPQDARQRLLYLNSIFARDPVLWSLVTLAGLLGFASLTWAGLRMRDQHS